MSRIVLQLPDTKALNPKPKDYIKDLVGWIILFASVAILAVASPLAPWAVIVAMIGVGVGYTVSTRARYRIGVALGTKIGVQAALKSVMAHLMDEKAREVSLPKVMRGRKLYTKDPDTGEEKPV